MLQQVFAVFFVLALLLGALWFLGKRGVASAPWTLASSLTAAHGSSERKLRVLERTVLTPQHSLHLVSVGGRELLLAVSPAGCHAVDLASALPEQAPKEGSGKRRAAGEREC